MLRMIVYFLCTRDGKGCLLGVLTGYVPLLLCGDQPWLLYVALFLYDKCNSHAKLIDQFVIFMGGQLSMVKFLGSFPSVHSLRNDS
jgi:hypothetical protein